MLVRRTNRGIHVRSYTKLVVRVGNRLSRSDCQANATSCDPSDCPKRHYGKRDLKLHTRQRDYIRAASFANQTARVYSRRYHSSFVLLGTTLVA